jgi:hypothetical protein
MRSDNKHIDEFFRNKLQEADADLSGIDQHWDAIKTALPTPLSLHPKAKPLPLLLKVAAILILVAGMTYLYYSHSGLSKSSDGTAQIRKLNKHLPNTPIDTPYSPIRFHDPLFYHFYQSAPGRYATLKGIQYVFDGNSFSSGDPLTTATIDSNAIAEDQKLNAAVFSNFFQQLKKRPEQFHIDTQRDTTIRCSEGTVLRIPANSFQTATGLAISGIINMHIQEFYSLADIIGNKLSTTSNGQMLETGGMLCIKAMFNNEEAKLKPGSAIDLSMPAPKFNPEMQLFMGDSSLPANEKMPINNNSSKASESYSPKSMDTFSRNLTTSASYNFTNRTIYSSGGGINWLPLGQQQMFYNNNKKIVTVLNMRNNPKSIYTTHRGNPEKSKTIGKFKIPFHAPQSKEEIRKTLLKKYSKYYDDVKVIRASKPLSKKRQSEKRAPWEWYETPYVADSVKIPISIATRLKYITVEDSLQFEKQWKDELELAKKRNNSYRELLQISDQYNFKIENLGWINCDMFQRYPPGRTAEFTMVPGISFEKEYVYSMIVFKNTNAALACSWDYGAIKTPRIPLGEQVTIVSIGVKEGKAYTCVQDLTITREKQQLEYKKSSPEDFKEQLARLGRVTSRG